MLKKLLLTVAAAGLLLGGAAMVQPTPAFACKSGCHKAAKLHYPSDRKARKAYRKHCKAEYRASKKH